MKKLILIAVVILAFMSCKKDRTCQCTTTISTDTSSVTSLSKITYEHSTKNDVRGNCLNSYSYSNGVTTKTECQLMLFE